jgi:hypothetical protein
VAPYPRSSHYMNTLLTANRCARPTEKGLSFTAALCDPIGSNSGTSQKIQRRRTRQTGKAAVEDGLASSRPRTNPSRFSAATTSRALRRTRRSPLRAAIWDMCHVENKKRAHLYVVKGRRRYTRCVVTSVLVGERIGLMGIIFAS